MLSKGYVFGFIIEYKFTTVCTKILLPRSSLLNCNATILTGASHSDSLLNSQSKLS